MKTNIDKLVAEQLGAESIFIDGTPYPAEAIILEIDGVNHQFNRFEPSSYFSDASIIIDLLRKQSDWGVHLSSYKNRFIANWHRYTVTAETPSLAICKMFLLSRGIEVR